ncbi:hypothetical protein LXL04_000812 [Taraxacum kok-saghyz]
MLLATVCGSGPFCPPTVMVSRAATWLLGCIGCYMLLAVFDHSALQHRWPRLVLSLLHDARDHFALMSYGHSLLFDVL